jgi:hypothetical protein
MIDCQNAGRAFNLTGPGAPGSSLIAGFNIVNGFAATDGAGGGICVHTCSVRIANCIVKNCAAQAGGGIYLANTVSVVKYCTVEGNYAYGGLNTDQVDGGGILVIENDFGVPGGSVLVSHCKIIDNHADRTNSSGGGIGVTRVGPFLPVGPSLFVDDCLVAGNTAGNVGGGIGSYLDGNYGTQLSVTDSTFVGNFAGYASGGVASSALQITIANCIFWKNTSSQTTPQISVGITQGTGSATVAYSVVRGGVAVIGDMSGFHYGPGIIETDPVFVNPNGPDGVFNTWDDDDFHLALSSPCIDAGDNDFVPHDLADIDDDGNKTEIVPRDLDLNSRFYDTVSVPDTGHGTPPIIDMGCYENQSG